MRILSIDAICIVHQGSQATSVLVKRNRLRTMNIDKVVFGFFIILALALNAAFVVSAPSDLTVHSAWILTAAIMVNLIATGLKLGDRSQIGALLLASSLVSDVLLIVARVLWIVLDDSGSELSDIDVADRVSIIAMASGALVANVISCLILVGDTLISRR